MYTELLVVIPCLNEEQTIEKLVGQLVRSSFTCPMRIVIADGGSTDRTVEIAQKLASDYPNVTYLPNPKRLQSAAINLAVKNFSKNSEFLIRLDAHADYPDDYCVRLLEEANITGAASVVVSMDTQGKTPFQRAVAAAQNSKLGNGGSAHRSTSTQGKWVDHGHHALMRIDAFTKVGGYDEGFSHNEDAELDTRLGKGGYKIWLTAKTNLIYYPRATPMRLFRQYFHYGKGRVRNIMKHRTPPKPRQMAPAVVAPFIVVAVGAPWCGLLALPLLFWAALCLGYGVKLGVKAHDNAIMMSGPAAMIMHLGWSLGFWSGIKEAYGAKKQ